LLFNDELNEQSSFSLMITRWFNPPGFHAAMKPR
jgi:hypothetical protein